MYKPDTKGIDKAVFRRVGVHADKFISIECLEVDFYFLDRFPPLSIGWSMLPCSLASTYPPSFWGSSKPLALGRKPLGRTLPLLHQRSESPHSNWPKQSPDTSSISSRNELGKKNLRSLKLAQNPHNISLIGSNFSSSISATQVYLAAVIQKEKDHKYNC